MRLDHCFRSSAPDRVRIAIALERLAGDSRTGRFCHGDTPMLADCGLVPQIHSAQRFECWPGDVPTVMRGFDHCMRLPAFASTRPSAHPDAPP